jgi:hypothetical protein
LLTAGATMLAFWTMPSRSSAPIVLPYVVFGSWFLLPLLTAMIVSE